MYSLSNRVGFPKYILSTLNDLELLSLFLHKFTFRQRLFSFVVKFCFHLKSYPFRVCSLKLPERLYVKLTKHNNWVAYCGIPGPDQKFVVAYRNNNEINILKFFSRNASIRINNECNAREFFYHKTLDAKFIIPEIINSDSNSLLIRCVHPRIQIRSRDIAHVFSLHTRLTSRNLHKVKIGEIVDNLPLSLLMQSENCDVRLFANSIIKLMNIYCDFECIVGPSHGDFTPWNAYFSKDREVLQYIDFESFNKQRSILHDYIHYILQSSILLYRKEARTMLRKNKSLLLQIIKGTGGRCENIAPYVLAYFIEYSVPYLYAHNNFQVHLQFDWLINEWNLLIEDMFSHIRNGK